MWHWSADTFFDSCQLTITGLSNIEVTKIVYTLDSKLIWWKYERTGGSTNVREDGRKYERFCHNQNLIYCIDNQMLILMVHRCAKRTQLNDVTKTHAQFQKIWQFLFPVCLFTKNYPICNIDLCHMVRPLASHWITANCKYILLLGRYRTCEKCFCAISDKMVLK